ncbi:hypothetical protein [Acinetobacter tianfuensis]|uniref:Uncharacterized protein n=1 Tax=Acinetobacter tianfuensis TaxID=2419603 RepID=A0A3A8EFV6_9GAMM|nr:hypothetical protein [Acinetobacter tianfuensis]RKG32978.1 hypothetical protein D7V32_04060 [Acinetobacter tianfuensis]
MATDVEVQFFSHLNGLVLSNTWGDMIRLFDACLVNGVALPSVTSASIDEQGDVHLALFAPHKVMLLQIVELTGFEPASLNQKYRIKGVPSDTQLILKPQVAIDETAVTTKGASKLASLGYDIIFRDDKDVKRVYRAKNPTPQHPFIRVDESISDGVNSYNSTYAKYAMVGLLEHMDHIDDYQNPDVLQLPFDPANPPKNWKISGTGGDCVRGWARWYWSRTGNPAAGNYSDSNGGAAANSNFTLVGDKNCFYAVVNENPGNGLWNVLHGAGLFQSSMTNDVIPNWFLSAHLTDRSASSISGVLMYNGNGVSMLCHNQNSGKFFTPKYDILNRLSNHTEAYPLFLGYRSGMDNSYKNNFPALEIPFLDKETYLRGSLFHICFAGKATQEDALTALIADSSMYVQDIVASGGTGSYQKGGFYFYLGELD